MTSPSGIITLPTDFGTRDAYAGAMKGVILGVNRHARLVDLSHDVAPQDIPEAAWLLRAAFSYFPAGTVHCVVVDPGVGSERRAIAAEAGGYLFVAPDNGVLSWALAQLDAPRYVELADRRFFRPDVSRTFHGRDVFAPVAAHLASGVPIDDLGPPVPDPVVLPLPRTDVSSERIDADVIYVDRYGNLITSLDARTFASWAHGHAVEVKADGRRIDGIARIYSDAAPGTPLALFGSSGHLEIAVRDGSAAAVLGLGRGARIVVRWRGP